MVSTAAFTPLASPPVALAAGLLEQTTGLISTPRSIPFTMS